MQTVADDMKAFDKAEKSSDQVKLQNAIDAMVQWTEIWLLEFNKLECKVLHAGKTNPKFDYHIGTGTDKVNLRKLQKKRILVSILILF